MNIIKTRSVVDTFHTFSKLPLGSVTARGWLREQLLRNKEGMGGHLDELEPDMIANPFINYSAFRKHPVLGEVDRTFAAGWSGEISGTYWTGLVQLAFTLGDTELIDKATTWVEGVLRHQEADGYLGSYPSETDRMADYNAWSAAWCYRALLGFYEATERRDVLSAVYRGLLWFCENWKDHKTDYAGSVIIEPMIIVYAYTGDKRLVAFCNDYFAWLEEHSPWPNTLSKYLSDTLSYVSMHAVAYGEEMKNPVLVYCATGDKQLLKAGLNAANKAIARIVQPTGGPSSSSEFLSPKGAAQETEYCNFSTYSHSYSWMTLATGDARWGDEIERCVFNGAEGARKKDERAIAYFTSPNQTRANRESCIWGDWSEYGVYAPCYHVACCPTQSVRILPEFVRDIGLLNEQNELHLFCYAPAEVVSPQMDLTIDTLYPFRDTITIQVTRAENAPLYLRIPSWCQAPSVTVNGEETTLSRHENGFARINTPLCAGDEVVVRFPMTVQLGRVDDSDSAARFPIVVERGPLVYALPVPELWSEYEGRPITPLPEGWAWYEASPAIKGEQFEYYYHAPWSKAIDESLLPERIRVVEHEPKGYVWEHPPVTLSVPLYHTKSAYMFLSPKMNEVFEAPISVEGAETYCEMVPHGCTNLRITYLPRAAVKK